jgi:hypothetical protein
MPDTSKPADEQQDYFLLCGEVVFTMPGDETPNARRFNTVVMSKDGRIAVTQIGRAQQALQLRLFQSMNDPNIKVLDVIILSMMPLGRFTPEEFNAAPPGQKLQVMGEPRGNA